MRPAKKREALRSKLFDDQCGICYLCGREMTLVRANKINVPNEFATFDHVIPRSDGGTDSVANIRLAHRICNLRKRSKPAWQSILLNKMLEDGG